MAEKSISGIDHLGRCVDIVYLDPLSIVNSCKPTQALLPKGGDDTFMVGEYSVPKGVEVMSPYRLRVSGGETTMSNSYDFTRSFEDSISIEGGFEGFSFSASQTLKNVEKFSESREETFTYVFAISAIHIVSFDLNGVQAQYLTLNANIRKAVTELPTVAGEAYANFIKEYGTHFLREVPLGGMCWSRVSAKNTTQSSSDEVEQTIKAEAKAELKKFTAGASKTSASHQVKEQDQKNGIKRSELTFVGGQGNVAEIPSEWVASLDAKSVPIHEGLKLSRLSSLLTKRHFPDDEAIDTKRKLLDEATTLYIRRKGGEEGRRIRYGDSVQLLSSGTPRRRVYYTTEPKPSARPAVTALYPQDPGSAPYPGGAATFTIHAPPGKSNGDEVLAGDLVNLQIKETGGYVTLEPKPGSTLAGLAISSRSAGPRGQWSLRIRGSGQTYEGPDMREKQKPLVSGDVVMISRFEPTERKFRTIAATHSIDLIGLAATAADADDLFARVQNNIRYLFIKHA